MRGATIRPPARLSSKKESFQHYGTQQKQHGVSWVVIISWFLITIWATSMVVAWKLGIIQFTAIDFKSLLSSSPAVTVESTLNNNYKNIDNNLDNENLRRRPVPDISSPIGSSGAENLGKKIDALKALDPLYKRGEFDVHVIFSTDCTPYQDWQSIALFYSAIEVKQQGPITRIVSGCDEAKKEELIKLYARLYPNHQYRAHFTPDFKKDEKTGHSYDFYNKPWGLKHWLEYAEVPLTDDTVVALIDPDMLFIRPLSSKVRGVENNLYDKSYLKQATLPDRVKDGVAVAQMYGLGAPWTNDNHKKFNRHFICGENSPCLQDTLEFGERHYSVGPPYVLTKPDMVRLSKTWTQFVPRVYQGYPYLLAEMYAYSMAAAHEKLPHLQLENYMISNTESSGEGWPWIDQLEDDEVCIDHDAESGLFLPHKPLPTVMHYCQNFGVKDINFGKRRVVQAKIFDCKSPLFVEPTTEYSHFDEESAAGQGNIKRQSQQHKRHAFSVCLIHRSLNRAITAYKKEMCGEDANFEKSLNLFKPNSVN